MKRTVAALVARGVDTGTASRLATDGWTVGNLRLQSEKDLMSLGLSVDGVAQLLGGNRPPIPLENAMRVLYLNRYQCCVCRDPAKPIILHHIVPWAKSRNHGEANLAVLCLEHHEKAHSVSALAKNLDVPTLRSLKQQWETACEEEDTSSIIQASRLDYDAWLYFNHLRLFELARQLHIQFAEIHGFDRARSEGLVDDTGNVGARRGALSYMYDDVHGMTLYHYVRGVLETVLERISVLNFSDLLDRGHVKSLLAPGDFVFVQGAHAFKRLTDVKRGKGEAMLGSRRANNVEFRFTFDRWEATSCSAWATWLTGRQSVASLLQVKEVTREDGNAVVSGTVIAISNGHHKLQHRNYSPRYGRYIFYDPSDDVDETDDWGEP